MKHHKAWTVSSQVTSSSRLQQAITWRELDTAANVTDVLVWRLRRLGNLPTTAAPTLATDSARTPHHERRASKRQAPELTRADYMEMIGEGISQDYPSLEAAARAVGYDGTLGGAYLHS